MPAVASTRTWRSFRVQRGLDARVERRQLVVRDPPEQLVEQRAAHEKEATDRACICYDLSATALDIYGIENSADACVCVGRKRSVAAVSG